MNSVFEKARKQPPPPSPYSYERIQCEVQDASRTKAKSNPLKNGLRIVAVGVFGTLLALFFLDVFLYPIQKSKAMRAFVYLNLYGDKESVNEIAQSGILSPIEVEELKTKEGDYLPYFANTREARQAASSSIAYVKALEDLHEGKPEGAGFLNQIRYNLFVQFSMLPPKYFSAFTPEAEDMAPPFKPGQLFQGLPRRDEKLEYTWVGAKNS